MGGGGGGKELFRLACVKQDGDYDFDIPSHPVGLLGLRLMHVRFF